MRLEKFIATYPFLIHATRESNVSRILRMRTLESAMRLIERAESRYVRSLPRQAQRVLNVDGEVVVLRDQLPLLNGQVQLADGFSIVDLVALLDRHVFFWPARVGDAGGGFLASPKYAEERTTLLRVRLADLLNANQNVGPFFCRYNSGAGRMSNGKASPRGPELFAGVAAFDGTPGAVTEVVFRDEVRLPPALDLREPGSAEFRRV